MGIHGVLRIAMRKDDFTKRKAVIWAETARFVGFLTEEELRRLLGVMIDIACSPLLEKGENDEPNT